MPIRVAIADDDALIRDSLKMILDLDEDIQVVGVCSNGDDVYKLCMEVTVDVILMDIRMPVCDGIVGTKKIKQAFPHIHILILTTFQDDDYIFQALKNGANGYLLKNTPSTKIGEQIKLAYTGTMLIHPDITDKLSGMLRKEERKDLSDYMLTPREIEIIEHISEGYSNKEIANKLYLGESTVKNYISGILNKLELRDRTQIAIFYLKNRT
ncbi:response regulator transcription factor [Vallitalea pronyensis]|uniref:Stage 0 sporulation protein A homolog n=1 Tax=Vallitalea pronyensis TaxID=1348613 RepID=A0A8J8SI13_9FIRM|nr:response regulator transcription factor [Vallitalea pronyensis]QUI24430.1 response regulator transcription factor [Vallitalea pronyensis]